MTRKVVDINEYRKQMATATGGEPHFFRNWSDHMLKTRYKVLAFIEGGATELVDMTQAIPRMAFPNGYDPDNHLSDNIKAIERECDRRGVRLPSE